MISRAAHLLIGKAPEQLCFGSLLMPVLNIPLFMALYKLEHLLTVVNHAAYYIVRV